MHIHLALLIRLQNLKVDIQFRLDLQHRWLGIDSFFYLSPTWPSVRSMVLSVQCAYLSVFTYVINELHEN